MIKIEIEAATGAEARKQMLGLLGLGYAEDAGITNLVWEKKTEEVELKTEEPAKGKRRTKAEIAADNATPIVETPKEEEIIPEGGDEQMAEEVKHPELVDLQRWCAILVRAGYKSDAQAIIKTTGLAETSKEVLPENRQVAIDALTKFAEDNKIAK